MRRYAWVLCTTILLGLLMLAAARGRSATNSTSGLDAQRAPVTIAPSTTSRSAPTEPGNFLDRSGSVGLLIQIAPGQPDTGDFTFSVYGSGTYTGSVTVTQKNTSVAITGTDLAAHATTEVGAILPDTAVRIAGRAWRAENRARATVWIGPPASLSCADGAAVEEESSDADRTDEDHLGDDCIGRGVTRYRIRTGTASAETAQQTTRQIVKILKREDWSALYKSLPPSISSRVNEAQFVAGIKANLPGHITDVQPIGDGDLVQSSGLPSWAQRVKLTVSTENGSAAYTTTILLIFEAGEWRLASTTAPQPS